MQGFEMSKVNRTSLLLYELHQTSTLSLVNELDLVDRYLFVLCRGSNHHVGIATTYSVRAANEGTEV